MTNPTDIRPARQPAIYIPHGGGPWPFMDDPQRNWESLGDYLGRLPLSLPQPPDAIVLVTAHWEATEFTVASGEQPALIYDYGGFPPHTYQLTYPAPGAPQVAQRIAELASAASIPVVLDPEYGWDHGVFVPVAVSWPDAQVPVVAVSLRAGLDPAEHLAFGAALAPLRDENIVIIGSGLSIHDLRFQITVDQATAFDEWLEKAMAALPDERNQALIRWYEAPHARAAHPREEHLLPLMVVAGAGGNDTVSRTYRHPMFDLPVAAYSFDQV